MKTFQAHKPVPKIVALSGPSPADEEHNNKLAETIRAYWRAQGQQIEVRVWGMAIRSRSLNGIPISEREAKRVRLEGWS